MRLTKRLQRQRSQWRKGQARHWYSSGYSGIPKYSPSQLMRAKRLLRLLDTQVSAIKTDYYVMRVY